MHFLFLGSSSSTLSCRGLRLLASAPPSRQRCERGAMVGRGHLRRQKCPSLAKESSGIAEVDATSFNKLIEGRGKRSLSNPRNNQGLQQKAGTRSQRDKASMEGPVAPIFDSRHEEGRNIAVIGSDPEAPEVIEEGRRVQACRERALLLLLHGLALVLREPFAAVPLEPIVAGGLEHLRQSRIEVAQ